MIKVLNGARIFLEPNVRNLPFVRLSCFSHYALFPFSRSVNGDPTNTLRYPLSHEDHTGFIFAHSPSVASSELSFDRFPIYPVNDMLFSSSYYHFAHSLAIISASKEYKEPKSIKPDYDRWVSVAGVQYHLSD